MMPRLTRNIVARLGMLLCFGLVAVGGCSDDTSSPTDAAAEAPRDGSGGAAGGGGAGGAGGTGGSAGSGGSGGTPGSDGGGSDGYATDGGTQPLGSFCVSSPQCDQSQGAAVCCAVPPCVSPCSCVLSAQCPGGTMFLECKTDMDCDRYGGGKICCTRMSGGASMSFCTKPSACN